MSLSVYCTLHGIKPKAKTTQVDIVLLLKTRHHAVLSRLITHAYIIILNTVYYAPVNFMPYPHPRGGWGNTGDLTNRVVKCHQVSCQIPTMSPGPRRGFDNTFGLSIVLL